MHSLLIKGRFQRRSICLRGWGTLLGFFSPIDSLTLLPDVIVYVMILFVVWLFCYFSCIQAIVLLLITNANILLYSIGQTWPPDCNQHCHQNGINMSLPAISAQCWGRHLPKRVHCSAGPVCLSNEVNKSTKKDIPWVLAIFLIFHMYTSSRAPLRPLRIV